MDLSPRSTLQVVALAAATWAGANKKLYACDTCEGQIKKTVNSGTDDTAEALINSKKVFVCVSNGNDDFLPLAHWDLDCQ